MKSGVLANSNYIFQSIIGFILIAVLGFIFIYIPWHIFPAEDAAILFQFSENFAETGSITYNLHGIRSEGATDFLWMIILAFMNFIGFNTYLASTILSMFALVGTAFILYKITSINNIYILYGYILLLIVLPMTTAAIQGFSPLFFGFFIALASYYFLNTKTRQLFVSTLFLTLVRPDGIVVTVPLIISYLIINKESMRENIILLLKYFILPGLIYFISRWIYFREFLPLPFYVKSNFDRYLYIFNEDSLDINKYIILKFIPFLILSMVFLIKDKMPKYSLSLIISLIIVPYIFYSSMMMSQNIDYRLQYMLVLGIIIVFSFSLRHVKSVLLFIIVLIAFVSQIYSLYPITRDHYYNLMYVPNNQFTYIAKGLNKITTDAKMAITEAGKLPYYSKWEAIDTWGLNTPQFSKKLIQPNDIRLFNPDLIVINAAPDPEEYYNFFSKVYEEPIYTKRTWHNQCANIVKGIDKSKYILLMVPFKISGKGKHYAYFLKTDFKYFNEAKNLLLKYKAKSLEEYTNGKIHW